MKELWEYVFKGICKWKMFDSEGNDVDFKESNFNEFPDWLKNDLLGEVLKASTLKEAELESLS
jgi:hypothetical protein